MKKSLYLFLSSLLGCLLFLIIHHAGLAVYDFIIGSPYDHVGFPPPAGMSWLITLAASGVLGLIYGLYLGIKWYDYIYGQEITKKLENISSDNSQRTITIKPTAGKKLANKIIEEQQWDLDDLKNQPENLPQPKKSSDHLPLKNKPLPTKPLVKTLTVRTSRKSNSHLDLVPPVPKLVSKTVKNSKSSAKKIVKTTAVVSKLRKPVSLKTSNLVKAKTIPSKPLRSRSVKLTVN